MVVLIGPPREQDTLDTQAILGTLDTQTMDVQVAAAAAAAAVAMVVLSLAPSAVLQPLDLLRRTLMPCGKAL